MFTFLERCQRGRMGRPAKALSGFNRTVGSNPTLSASRRVNLCSVFVLPLFALSLFHTDGVYAACDATLVVKRGDSWWSVAQSANTTMKRILSLNRAVASTPLIPGDKICVPIPSQVAQTTYSSRQVEAIIRDVWPDDLEDRAIFIARRESKLQPMAVGNPNNCCYGLFQIYFRWHKQWLLMIGVTRARQLLDPRVNAEAALMIYRRNRGWGPWE